MLKTEISLLTAEDDGGACDNNLTCSIDRYVA